MPRNKCCSKWSKEQYAYLDFDNDTISGAPGDIFFLEGALFDAISNGQIFKMGSVNRDEDGTIQYELDYRIDYIRIHLRAALGESESTSAVSQTFRLIMYRTDDTYDEAVADLGAQAQVVDVDGPPHYNRLTGSSNGLYYDTWRFLHSWATDSDTTAGGQCFVIHKYKPLYTNVVITDEGGSTLDTHKGIVLMQIVGDDPDGTNATIFGYVEFGWRYKLI